MRRPYVFFDLVIVLVFVGIGRSVHDHGVNLVGMLSIAWPFVVGLAVGWFIVARRNDAGRNVKDGVIVCLATVVIGMLLRLVAGQGTAFAFVLVALGFLGALMLAWRLVLGDLERRRRSKSLRRSRMD